MRIKTSITQKYGEKTDTDSSQHLLKFMAVNIILRLKQYLYTLDKDPHHKKARSKKSRSLTYKTF